MTRVIVSLLAGALLFSGGATAASQTDEKKSAKEEKRIGLDRRVAEKLLVANERLAAEQYDAALAIVDRHLESRMFLAGDNFTVSDIALGCGVWRWMALPIEHPLLPNIQRWFDSLADRPAYKKIVMLPLS